MKTVRRSVRLVCALGCSLLFGGAGCRNVETLKQRCLAGESAACESACSKGVAGEGGCFHAGQEHRQKASLDVTGAEFRRATDYFVKACDGHYADGCLLAAQMVEAPYAQVDLDGPGDPGARAISDAELALRDQRLQLACTEGSSGGCKKLGDALIGKSSDQAQASYDKACTKGADEAGCKAARVKEVGIAERWRQGCTHRVADDCTRLGDLLYATDPPRAVRLFISECALRGVADLEGGVGNFVRERARQAKNGIPPGEALPIDAARGDTVGLHVSSVSGQVAIVDSERTLNQHRGEIGACLSGVPSDFTANLAVRLIVDQTGAVFRATLPPNALPARAGTCMEAVFEAISVTPPVAGTATVDVVMHVGETEKAPSK